MIQCIELHSSMKNSLIAIMKKCDDNGRLIWFVNKIDIIVPKTKAERQEYVQHARKFGSNL
jgi:hypothetical protein